MTPEERQASHVEMLRRLIMNPPLSPELVDPDLTLEILKELAPPEEHRTIRQRLTDACIFWGYRLDEWRIKRLKKKINQGLEKALADGPSDDTVLALTIQHLQEWVKEL